MWNVHLQVLKFRRIRHRLRLNSTRLDVTASVGRVAVSDIARNVVEWNVRQRMAWKTVISAMLYPFSLLYTLVSEIPRSPKCHFTLQYTRKFSEKLVPIEASWLIKMLKFLWAQIYCTKSHFLKYGTLQYHETYTSDLFIYKNSNKKAFPLLPIFLATL